MNTENLTIKCDLTDEEMLEISKQMSEHLNKKKQAEDNLSAYSSQLKSEIKGHDAIINKSATLISAGYEYREIKCEVQVLEANDMVVWIRLDTHEICQKESPIPPRYLQKKIEFNDDAPFN